MKKIVRALAIASALMTAILAGLLGAFLDPRTYGAPTSRAKRQKALLSSDGPASAAMFVPEAVQASPYHPEQAPVYEPAPAAVQTGYPQQYNPQNYEQAAHPEYDGMSEGNYSPQPHMTPEPVPAMPQSYTEQAGVNYNPYAQSMPVAQPASMAAPLSAGYTPQAYDPSAGPQPYDAMIHGGSSTFS